jgi:hypothetical protein
MLEKSERKITEAQGAWIGSLLTLGACLGAIPTGSIANFIGRKRTLQMLALPLFASWLTIAYGYVTFSPKLPDWTNLSQQPGRGFVRCEIRGGAGDRGCECRRPHVRGGTSAHVDQGHAGHLLPSADHGWSAFGVFVR